MYIIDKNKDYYDYFKGIYGIDKTITYDRRGSAVLSEMSLMEHITPFEMNRTEGTYTFILEVGTVQYLFKAKILFRITDIYSSMARPYRGKFELIKVFKDHKHYFPKEISLVPVNTPHIWSWKRHEGDTYSAVKSFSDLDVLEDKRIDNPILKDTSIASLIPPMDIWIELTNFISSKYNDKTVTIVNSDVDKAVNHGFDKKTSFRNPIKERYL